MSNSDLFNPEWKEMNSGTETKTICWDLGAISAFIYYTVPFNIMIFVDGEGCYHSVQKNNIQEAKMYAYDFIDNFYRMKQNAVINS